MTPKERRNMLIARTISVIAGQGLDKTTTKAITDGTGINEAYIYRYFVHTLTNSEESMCRECKGRIGAEIAREHAGFVGGTQVSRIVNVNRTSSNTSGCRGVYLDRKTGKYRARLKFKGKIMSFGTFRTLEDAVAARKAAEELYFGEFLDEIGYRREEDGAV